VNDRYGAMFERLRGERSGAFGAFVMLGDPDPVTTGEILDALVAGGSDMIEVGIPFSDPVADGPTIQGAAERALAKGITPADCFDLLASFRRRHPHVPVGILTYANIVLARGREHFYRAAAESGVDSVLIADVPAFEAEPYAAAAKAAGVAPVLIAAPNTPAPTLARVAMLGQGYTYCIGRSGVTGVEREMRLQHGDLFATLAGHDAPPPILGFGISKPAQVRMAIEAGAAGIISGSAIVDLIARNPGGEAAAVRGFVASMKNATKTG
jgi:tryptophan synthase alpha chain